MNFVDIISEKRDGKILTDKQIGHFIKSYTEGTVPDYQASALLMAIYLNGLNRDETFSITKHMVNSGETVDLTGIEGIKVDKHSTGGVGDKTTLVVAPIVASFGVSVPKMSGRGLGHTGGTVDKLDSIPGFNTSLTTEQFINTIRSIKMAVTGQTANIAAADKKLYRLRDVTATVDSIPLIASSIMGKKIALGSDCIVLDVKLGNGAFMTDMENALKLSRTMIDIGEQIGKKILCVITDMSIPLGDKIGNANEVIEAIDTLKGKGPEDFTELCMYIAGAMLYVAGKCNDIKSGCSMAQNSINDQSALVKFKDFISYQGGNTDIVDDYSILPKASYSKVITSDIDGYINKMDCKAIGIASMKLGAGRRIITDVIDYGAGITIKKKTGSFVKRGDVLAEIYSNNSDFLADAELIYKHAVTIGSGIPEKRNIIKALVDKDKTEIYCTI